jgi:putative transposase
MNFLHHKSKELATSYDAVIMEDLDMQGLSQALHFRKSVHDNGWGMFTRFLEYKLKEQGKQLIKIDKWFPSTKKCSCCGKEQDLPLSERVYKCSCGLVLNRDHNSSINIKKPRITNISIKYNNSWNERVSSVNFLSLDGITREAPTSIKPQG